ncbi:MAG: DUF3276 family protein [Spirochaetaceae bacterium]|nr:DUF3276 family protein [Spirochaetaceae bacterium]
MGIRGELFSTKASCEGRTYFFNVKENRMGDMFLTVVESKPTEADSFDRRSIVVFREDLPGFLKAMQEALGFMGKDGETPKAPRFAPSEAAIRASPLAAAQRAAAQLAASQRRKATSAAGFAGSESAEAKEPARKRKILVKRKVAKPEDGKPGKPA